MATVVDPKPDAQHPNAPVQAPAHQPRTILMAETDARFAAQAAPFGFKAGQHLDPTKPADAALIPLWNDTYAKVKAEDAAGKLVLTYNNPHVAQNLADAHVADQATALHADAAAAAADPAEQQQHVAAAATAADVAAQKKHDAAKLQPPTVSPQRAHEAAQAVSAAPPPPPNAPARDQLAHAQAQGVGRRADKAHSHHRGKRPVKSSVDPAKIQDYRAGAAQLAHQGSEPFVLVSQHPDGTPERLGFGSRAELDAAYAKLSEQHGQYKYVAAFDIAASPTVPIVDSLGVSAAEHVEQPAPAAGSADTGSADAGATSGAGAADSGGRGTYADPGSTPSPGWSTGQKIAAAIAAIAAVSGVAYLATRKSKPAARARTVKVTALAMPTQLMKVP